MLKQKLNKTMLAMTAAIALSACDKGADSFSLLAEQENFKQASNYVPKKMDILWVVDNSGSMASSQQNLATNFNSFIQRFSENNYDFHMAVTTSDAYEAYYTNDNNLSRVSDGVATHSGVRVLDRNTPNLQDVFITNITQGTSGNGDERAFSSFQHTLSNPLNSDFRREGAFLAIIIVSDEEDTSHTDWQNGWSSYVYISNTSDSRIHPISNYISYLDTLTGSTSTIRNYSVNTISILDTACKTALGGGRKIGQRYMNLADATGGAKISLCSNFADTLSVISDSIIELASTFQLNREPVPETLQVTVNGVPVQQSSTNGWTYEPSTLTISFHGAAVPPADANVQITFDPVTIIQ
jgi:hypothetical protein